MVRGVPRELDPLVRYTPVDQPDAGRSIALARRATDPRHDQFELLASFMREVAPAAVRGPGLSVGLTMREEEVG